MLVVTTVIVWMTQTLQRIEILVEYGQGMGTFAWLSMLIIPSLLAVIIPFALFGSVIYAFYRLQSDSEVAVMFAAGVSRYRLMAPIMLITVVAALATLYINVDLMPRSYRVLKQSIADIRADFASTLLRSGEFTSLADGITVYIDEARPGGQFVGLIINDFRNPDKSETYMAQRAIIQDTENGPLLLLRNGNIQRQQDDTDEISFIRFEQWSVDLSGLRKKSGELQLELTERYLGELFNPDLTKPYDRQNERKLIAEGHARLTAPIYTFAYVFIGMFALIGGAYGRGRFLPRVIAACIGVFVLRVSGFLTQGFSETSGIYWVQYLLPIGCVLIFAFLLYDRPSALRSPTPPAPPREKALQ